MNPRILIAAGGSGGHIFPAIAVARRLKEREKDIEIRFVGSSRALDRRIFEKEGFDFRLLSANRMPYTLSPAMIPFFFWLAADMIRSLYMIAVYRPHVVLGFGGYVSVPVMLVSRFFGIPEIIHEQNLVPGRANTFLFKLVKTVTLTFEETKKYASSLGRKVVVTGNPIRERIFKNDKEEGKKALGLEKSKFTILVIGGSQGATFLNETFAKMLELLDSEIKETLQVVHITGVKDYEKMTNHYTRLGIGSRVYSFIDRIEDAYSASDLVVTRAGASALFELALFGKPMVLIPYPFAMSHQKENALFFARNGAAVEMDEKTMTPDIFRERISELFKDRELLSRMGHMAKTLSMPQACDNLAGEVLNLIGKQ